MAWTSPRTWVAGETLTAALLNTHVRDNLKAMGDAWTAYTPTWTGSSGSTSVGTGGSLAGAYIQMGKLVIFRAQIQLGTASVTFPTGAWNLSLPVEPVQNVYWSFSGLARDDSAGTYYALTARVPGGGSVMQFSATPATAGGNSPAVNSTVPFTWAVNDALSVNGVYQAS